jgi:hypothetical protein
MKKTLQWMLATILLCGLSVTILTACSSKDDEDDVKSYDVTFAVVLPRATASYFDVQLTLTDGSGKQTEQTVTKAANSESFNTLEEQLWSRLYTPYTQTDTLSVTADDFSDNIVCHYTVKATSGQKVEYNAIVKARNDYPTAEAGQTTIIFPVMLAYFLEKGKKDVSYKELTTMHIWENIKAEELAGFLRTHDGDKVRKGKVTLP